MNFCLLFTQKPIFSQRNLEDEKLINDNEINRNKKFYGKFNNISQLTEEENIKLLPNLLPKVNFNDLEGNS